MSRIDVRQAAKTLGGRVERADRIRVPGPNDKKRGRNDDSLMVFFGDDKPEGYEVYSHSGDDWRECRDYVRDRLGLPAWKPDGKPRAVFVADEFIYEHANGFPYHRIDLMSDGTYRHFWFESDGWDEKHPPMLIPFALPDMQSDETIWLVRGEDNARLIRDGFNQVATTFPSGINEPPDPSFLHHFADKDVRLLHVGGAESRKFCAAFSEALNIPVWSLPDGVASLRALARSEGASMDDCAPASELPDNDTETEPFAVTPTAFTLGDPTKIPPRKWIYEWRLIRGFTSLTVSPGGIGKSSLALVDALSMVTGRALFEDSQINDPTPLSVWYWNGEDPQEETARRIAAAAIHYNIKPEEIEGRLYTDTGREQEIVFGAMNGSAIEINEELFASMERAIVARKIDVLILDPFVSVHRLSENDNTAIDAVIKRLNKLADRTGCAVEIVHHTRKPPAGSTAPTDANDARGASAILGAVRSARSLNVMSEDIAEEFDIPKEDRAGYFSIAENKANLSARSGDVKWRKLESVALGNQSGFRKTDNVGVVTSYKPKKKEVERTNNLIGVESAIIEVLSRNDMTRHWGGRGVPPKGWLGKEVIESMGLIDVPNGMINRIIKNMLNDKKIVLRTTWAGGNNTTSYTLPGADGGNVTPLRPDQWPDEDDAPF